MGWWPLISKTYLVSPIQKASLLNILYIIGKKTAKSTKALRLRGLARALENANAVRNGTRVSAAVLGTGYNRGHRAQHPRKSSLIGLAAVHSLNVYNPHIDYTVSVFLEPNPLEYMRRFQARSRLVGRDTQRPGLAGFSLKDESDIILRSDGCPEQTLRDVCLAVLSWLYHAAEAAYKQRALEMRFTRIMTMLDIGTERISQLYDESGASKILADKKIIEQEPENSVVNSNSDSNGISCFVAVVLIWPTVYNYWNDITSYISRLPACSITHSHVINVTNISSFIWAIYKVDDIKPQHVRL